MTALCDLQERFAQAVLAEEEQACPWLAAQSAPFFTIHRNNTRVLLREALAGVFPVTKMLVGDDFFAHAAGLFILETPPRSPVLLEYGSGFPSFLAALPAAAGVPYLGDAARLEWALYRAYHAADAAPLSPAVLADMLPERAADLVFTPHPSLTLVRSPHAIDQIWQLHQDGGPTAAVKIDDRAACFAVVRPHRAVEIVPFTDAAFRVVEALAAGTPLAQAIDAGLAAASALAVDRLLAEVLAAGLFASVTFAGMAGKGDFHD